MKNRLRPSWSVLPALALLLLASGAAAAQDTKSQKAEVIKFEVISVDGNALVVRDQNGTRELTVPDDFKFTVDGKQMSVHDLTAGMKGTATVTTTTTVRPVYVTEIRKGVVVRRIRDSVDVRNEEGVVRRFTKDELNARNVKIYMDGKQIRLGDLKGGDQLSATIVTAGPPLVLTEKDVQAALDTPEPAAAEAPAETPAVAATETPAAEPQTTAAATPPPAAAVDATKSETPPPDRRLLWIALIAIVVIGGFLLMRKRGAQS
jgi:hypothetical protein